MNESRQRSEKLRRIARGELYCDCSRVATHLDSHADPECDYCKSLNHQVVQWHQVTRQHWFWNLGDDDMALYEKLRARRRSCSGLIAQLKARTMEA